MKFPSIFTKVDSEKIEKYLFIIFVFLFVFGLLVLAKKQSYRTFSPRQTSNIKALEVSPPGAYAGTPSGNLLAPEAVPVKE